MVLLIGITLVAFVLTHLVPGDPAAANLGQRAIGDPAAVAAFRHQYGLDRPLPVQYVLYLKNLLHGNLGISEQSHRPVRADLAEYIPATIELALFAIVLSLVIGIGLGIVAAVFRDRWPDHLIRVLSLGGVSMPVFWIALVAFYLLFFQLGWLPGGGRLDPTLEIMGNDYVRAARLKGLPERVVILRHVLRPALVSIITVAGVAFGSLLSGTVLVENIFSWPGVGQYAYRSAVNLDLPAIMGVSLFVALVYIVVNLVVDLLYGVIDPRIRLS